MYIEEIILEGFKTYATRTVISGFDRSFNAITGLNGSGKSNILDAICFVLGITNLSQVRVNSLQELVYKQGQAGITKASVTIVFNNEDSARSPVGWAQYDRITVTRQVVIGGRNKYLINGHNAQANRVQNLFHSVQLNVNNPHFLIMQGKILKVISMKPIEVLAMIEEAAGTRMFEMKKQNALKTIAKKDKKVEEINKVLKEEITPTLENLRKERALYIKWSNNQSDIERLTRFTVAYEYTKAQETLTASSADLQKMEDQLDSLKARENEINEILEQHKEQLAKLAKQKEKDMEHSLKAQESAVSQLSKELVKLTSEHKHTEDTLRAEEQKVTQLNKSIKEVTESISEKKKDLEVLKADSSKVEEKNKKLADDTAELQRKYEAMAVGMSVDSTSGGNKTLADRLMDAKRDATNAATELKGTQLKIKHINEELKEKKKLAQHEGKEYTKLKSEHEALTKEMDALKKSLSELNFDEEHEKKLLRQKREEEAIVAKLSEEVDSLSAQLSNLQFVYSDPEKNFDRSKVKGLVANLIEVKDAKTSLALEVTAGSKLFNVVVDTEQTGKQLLKNGKLKKRVTIIPLNKISARSLDAKKIKLAQQQVGVNNATLALSLIGYDDEIENAMKFVFGSTIVCADSASAKKVAFDKEIKSRCVTLDGDVFDPSGTLTGGSRSQSSSILTQLQQLNESRKQLTEHKNILAQINKQLADSKTVAAKYKDAKQKFELKNHEIELLTSRLNLTSHHQILEKVRELEADLEKENAHLVTLKEREVNALKEAKEIEAQMQNFEGTRDSQLKQIESAIAKSKNKLQASNKELKAKHQEIEQLSLEIAELQSELKSLQEQLKSSNSQIESLRAQVEAKQNAAIDKKSEYETAHAELTKRKEKLLACDKSIADLMAERDKLTRELTDNEVERKKLEHKIFRYHKDKKDAAKFVEHLEQKYVWLATEKQFFGKPGTEYDFKAKSPTEAQKDLSRLQDEQAKLAKHINKKVMSMFEKAEQEYQELMEKKKIIENDKAKIEAVIRELEEKKNEALNTTWQKVNKDFGSIFSTLLPGTSAKLEPPEGKTVLDGLEMKVAFGSVWKESLSELSGGQRSLLALSLILSLLLFKPAPMYILDEIDAALDLSHTQNIGQMLKTHFSNSQFIVVSLKEHMFNNANVLFRVDFHDGVSNVKRTENKSHKK